MKYLLSVLFVLALFCGLTTQAHAGTFHVGATDPNSCSPNDTSSCFLIDSGPLTGFDFTTAGCSMSNAPEGAFCIALFNGTGETITSITLTILTADIPPDQTAMCDTTADFFGSCSTSGDNSVFSFTDGNFKPRGTEVIYVVPDPDDTDFNPSFLSAATVTVTETPEPDSLLLFSTGVMMAGLYMAKRPLLSAFGKK